MSLLAKIVYLLSAALLALSATQVVAQDAPRPGYGPDVNTATAKKIAAGVVAECAKNKWNVAVAVVDTHGLLIYFERMEDTQTVSSQIAIDKAKAAATYRRPTRAFVDAIAKGGPAIMTLPGVVASPGGVPLMVSGKVTGAVGVSGVTGDQDEQCAKAGVGAM
jgi:glc operon protein GlcG